MTTHGDHDGAVESATAVAPMPGTPAGARPTGLPETSGRPGTPPARYAVGMFGTSIPINMFTAFMAYFYIVELGMDGRAYAAVMGVYAVIDAIDNPVYGYLSDRTRSRWGRRRPWMILAAPILAISFILFFSPPTGLEGTTLIVWFAVFTVLTGTSDSLVNANYGALLPELFPNERRRAVANSLRQGFQLVAMIISVALTPMITTAIGYSRTAMIFGAVAAVVIIFCALGAREDPRALSAEQPRLLDSLRVIVANRKFWLIAVTSGLYSAGMALVIAAVAFFVKYTLRLPEGNATYLLATVIGISAMCLLLWTRLVRRYGPEPIWRIALIVLALALASMSLANSLATAIVCGALVGLGYSGVMATMDLIVARLLDEDTARTGVRREGMFLSAFGFFNRLNAFVKSLGFLAVAALFGFHSGDDTGTRPDEAARFLLSTFPFVLVTCAAILSRFVRFDRGAAAEIVPTGTIDGPAGAEVAEAAAVHDPNTGARVSDDDPPAAPRQAGEPPRA
ncbi:MFS transporter [Occultella glacieicola]|uniref:MFS transporter n=1 Tax=Occultella glacieicola TaxID=2518684 RepID=A0ABY2DX74_9MICO|nr:MFS transporter [Occultella glacieicola]TDE88467.1 MFS transporter [Occultella glacieicola]